MLVSFNEICDSSRIWIFQSDLKIENNKIELIKNELEKFLVQWSSHGKEPVSYTHLTLPTKA